MGGVQEKFTLSAKGTGSSSDGAKLTVKGPKTQPTTAAANATLALTLAKGTLQTALAAAGLANTTTPKAGQTVTLTLVVILQTQTAAYSYTGSVNVLYTATANKSGSAKQQ